MSRESGSPVNGHPFEIANLCRYFSQLSPLPKVAVEGATHIVRYLNPAFAQLVGKDRSELIDRPFSEAVPEGLENGCLELLDRVFRTGEPESLVEQEHRQETTSYWSYVVWAIVGPDERPAGVMIQVTDATEVSLFRQQVTAMNEKLLISSIRQHELTEMAETLNSRLQTALHHKNHFMAVLSHELRTPLSPVVSAVWLLRQSPDLDEATRDYLEMIDRNVALEVRLIDDLLDLTRIDQGKMHLEFRPVDLGKAINHAVEVCGADLASRKVTLDVDADEGAIVVEADPVRLQQVLWNLLRNAIKFSPVGGHVQIHSRRLGESSAVVEVSDRGVGIEPDLIPHIFNAFQQGDADQVRRFGGLGLGLAISKTIVELHGGTITAQSPGKGQGSVFSVRLPVMASVPTKETPGGSTRADRDRTVRILLVEDHADTGKALQRLLIADGYTVDWARDVANGLRLATEQAFDLLLSDLGLPDGSGFDLMRTLRERGSTLPGITLSGYGQDRDIMPSGDSGFVAHLTKPVEHGELLALIREVTDNLVSPGPG